MAFKYAAFCMKVKADRVSIKKQGVILRHLKETDREEFIRKALRSKVFHSGFADPPDSDIAFEQYLRNSDTAAEKKFVILETKTSKIAGAINFSQIYMKGFCSAYLGYYLFSGFEGRRLMTDGLRAAIEYGFVTIGLHRLEANIQPENERSIELVKRCGFTREGFSRKYLKVGGEWRDHERWAILREDWEESELR